MKAVSRFTMATLAAVLFVSVILVAWLLLRPEQREDFEIQTSIKPDTYLATRSDDSPAPETATGEPVVQDGYGVVTHSDGSIYVGNFVKGQSQGKGKITYPGGASYEGEFEAGLPHGNGVCTYSSGESEDCIFLLGQRQ